MGIILKIHWIVTEQDPYFRFIRSVVFISKGLWIWFPARERPDDGRHGKYVFPEDVVMAIDEFVSPLLDSFYLVKHGQMDKDFDYFIRVSLLRLGNTVL